MATTSFTSLRGIVKVAIVLMLLSFYLPGVAVGQTSPAVPPVTATAPIGLNHPTGWKTIEQTAIDTNGDWLVEEFPDGGLFEFPVGGGAMQTLVPLGGLGNNYNNSLVLLDPDNNIYLGGNWSNCMLEFPYNAATDSWTNLSELTAKNPSANFCNGNTAPSFAQYSIFGFSPYYFQPFGSAIGPSNSVLKNTMVISNNNGGFMFGMYIQGAWNSPSVAQNSSATFEILASAKARAISVAIDPEGDIYFVEDSGGLPGVNEIPASMVTQDMAAGTAGVKTTDTSAGIVRVDPSLPDVTGVVTDAAGNLYISDGQEGVFMVPNGSGTPQTSAAVMLTPLPAQGEIAIDPVRKILYVPTTQTQQASLTNTAPYTLQKSGQADVAKVGVGYAEFGAEPVGTATATSLPVDFSFNTAVTPDRVVIMENGQLSNDFNVTGGTCTFQTAYAANTGCSESIAMTPHSVGDVSGELLLQESNPVPQGAPDSNDSITQFSISSKSMTIFAKNTLTPGEEIVITASASDCLASIAGQEFNVVAPSATQFTLNTTTTPPASCQAKNGLYTSSATLTAKAYTTLATIGLHGTGLGAIGQVSGGVESTIGSTLKTPSQVTVDGAGNVYVADPGQHQVLMYPAGSGSSATPTALGTGLTSPTGVAVDGAGDIFIADSGAGAVYEMPVAPPGLNSTGGQITLPVTGLGTSGLSLAVDGLGDLYIADSANGRIVKLSGISASSAGVFAESATDMTTGAPSSQPIAVAVDSNNNLYVLDGASESLYEFNGGVGTPTTLLSGLSGDTGVAADPSGAIYLSSSNGTTRVPVVNGAVGAGVAIAPDVPSSASVALDALGNIYIAPAAGPGITLVSTNGALVLPAPNSSTSSTMANAAITNAGNVSLSFTGYNDYSFNLDSVTVTNFTGADGNPACIADSPIAAGESCQVVVTFTPGPGQQGTLTGSVQAVSNALNGPLTINTTGTGLGLANAQAQIAVGSGPQVIGTPLSVTVTASGTGPTPTGTVQVSFPSWTVVVPTNCNGTCSPTINPVTLTQSATLDSKGTAQFTVAPVLAGPQTFTVGYTGDRVYGSATGTAAGIVAKSAITGFLGDPNPPPYLPFIEEGNPPSSVVPYDGSNQYWTYSMPVTVQTAIGIPTGTITFNDDSTVCPPGTSASGVGPAVCLLTNVKGVACPQSQGAAVQSIANNTTYTSATEGATALFNTSCLPMPEFTTYTPVVSTHYITPVYSGDANFLGATDPTSTVFQALTGPLVTISPKQSEAPSAPVPVASVTVSPGSTANLTLYLAPLLGYGFQGKGGTLNDYNFPVTLTCDNLPPHTACTFAYPSIISPYQPSAPNSVQICPQPALDSNSDTAAAFETLAENGGCNANGVGVVTLTINTNVAVGTTTTTSRNAAAASVTLASIFGLGMFGLFFRRRAFQKGQRWMMTVLMILGCGLAVTLSACNTTNLTPLAQLATPSGTYAVSITASQVGSQCVTASTGTSNCTTASGGNGTLAPASNNQVSLPYHINLTVQ